MQNFMLRGVGMTSPGGSQTLKREEEFGWRNLLKIIFYSQHCVIKVVPPSKLGSHATFHTQGRRHDFSRGVSPALKIDY